MAAIGAAALVPAAWLGAEYALDREEIAAIERDLGDATALYASAAGQPEDAGERAACDAVSARIAPLLAPAWYRHVGASMVEAERVAAISQGVSALRERAVRRSANRTWWRDLAAAMDAALADPARPDRRPVT